MTKETKELIFEAVKAGICKGKTLKGIPKTVRSIMFPPPGSASTMTNTPAATPA